MEKNWETISAKLVQLSKVKGGKEWLLPYLTVADFKIVDLSFYLEKAYPKGYAEFPFLGEMRNRFENLKAIKQYYEQPQSVKGPFVSPGYAAFEF